MVRLYEARNWYWFVGNDFTQVYSSSAFAFVPLSDPAYLAFLADGNVATRIASVELLRVVLNDVGVVYLNELLPPIQVDRTTVPRARVRLTAGTPFPVTSGVARSVPWETALSNPLAMWALSPNQDRITIPQTGTYRILAAVRFIEGTRTGIRSIQAALGLGAPPTDLGTLIFAPALAGDTSMIAVDQADLVQGDILRIFVAQGSGGTINCVARVKVEKLE